jgi:hypothetical protein
MAATSSPDLSCKVPGARWCPRGTWYIAQRLPPQRLQDQAGQTCRPKACGGLAWPGHQRNVHAPIDRLRRVRDRIEASLRTGRITEMLPVSPRPQGVAMPAAWCCLWPEPPPLSGPHRRGTMRGRPVATIEAMKMETAIAAPVAGTVQQLAVGGVQQVEGGDLLVVLRWHIANRGSDGTLRAPLGRSPHRRGDARIGGDSRCPSLSLGQGRRAGARRA